MKALSQSLRRRHSERGASVVELALILPILALVFMGIAEYGFAFYDLCSLDGAVRAALAYAVKNPADTTGITTVAQSAGGTLTNNAVVATSQFCECSGGSSVSCGGTCPVGTMRKYVQVTLTVNYSSPLTDMALTAAPATLSAQASMRMQ